MAAGIINLVIEQGATFRYRLIWKLKVNNILTPVDITGYTAMLQFRSSFSSKTAIITLTEVLSDDGQIILGTDDGSVEIYITNSVTYRLTAPGVYDLELVSPGIGDVTRLIQGTYTIAPNVTRIGL